MQIAHAKLQVYVAINLIDIQLAKKTINPHFSLESTSSLAFRIASKICRSPLKAWRESEIKFLINFFNWHETTIFYTLLAWIFYVVYDILSVKQHSMRVIQMLYRKNLIM